MKKIIFVILLLSSTFYSQQEIQFEFDFGQFKYDSTSNYLEIYYSIIPSGFSMIMENNSYQIKGKMYIQIQKSETQELVVNKEWGLNQIFKNESEHKNGKALLGVVGFILKEGNYTIDISVEDATEENKNKSYTEKISIVPYFRESFSISDIELATRIINENVNENSIFYKNTLEVYPNPSIIFTENAPVMFYYSELYDLHKSPSDNLVLKKSLFNSSNVKIYETSKKISAKQQSIVEIGLVNLRKYPTDTYTFSLTLIDEEANKYTSTSKRLFLLNPKVKAAETSGKSTAGVLGSEFGVLSLEECDDLFDKSKLIATSEEIEQYDVLDSLNNKREFLYNFWKKRDDIPATPAIEFKTEYLKRIDIASKRYRTITSPGYKTDRGRIFTRLGDPDEIERHPNETNMKPYEIWYYYQIEGGVYFIFGDYTGFNFYELLHSTMRGELQDPNWSRRLQTK